MKKKAKWPGCIAGKVGHAGCSQAYCIGTVVGQVGVGHKLQHNGITTTPPITEPGRQNIQGELVGSRQSRWEQAVEG